MSEFNKPTDSQTWLDNFEQIKPAMTATLSYNESSRCLFCYDAPCQKACPTSIDIPLFIRQIYSGNVTGAAKTIYDSNYLGHICGKVCPTEVLCEGACVYNNENDKPIEIGRLQSFATTHAIKNNTKIYQTAPDNGKRIAVIGAGPAGIGAACELRRLGYNVEIFERKAQPSGLALYGVAPYKITNEEVLEEIAYLQAQFGFVIHYNHPIESAAQIAELEANYDAVFLGIGLGNTSTVGLEGEDLQGVIGATEFIEALKLHPLTTHVGTKVVVIGGGNTAMDAASESARMGAEQVTLAYRRSKSAMAAYEFEYDLAKGVGVKGLFNVNPLAILTQNGRTVSGVRFIRTEERDGKLQPIAGSEFEIACDAVIKATGQEKQRRFLDMIPNLKYDHRGCIITNSDFQTGNSKFFASGDALNGGAEVVNAVGESKKAAQAIHRLLAIND